MRHATTDTRRAGFTLIEVLIALAIFSVGSLGALGMMLYVMDANRDGQHLSEITTVGRAEMERIMGQTVATGLTDCSAACTAWNLGGCTNANCWREVRASQFGPIFQVDSHRTATASAVTIRVAVRYPKDRSIRTLANGGTPPSGWVDCIATPDLCRAVFFYNQKVNQ